ncbi:MAG TPA: Crp/Fnr family transcriptional regulator [Actinomycetaceae bacterium]|nr:Crp/Fnr family transcriptional regulator [Actinomycetaceae bacterium]
MDEHLIANVPLFEALSEEDQKELSSIMEEVTFRRGEKLFSEGDRGDRLYLLVDGKVKLGHASSDGRENLIAVLGAGEMIGELTLFDPGPRSTTATAVAPTTMMELDHEAMMEFLDTRPELAKHMLKALSQRLRRTNDQLADLVFSDVPGRVAKALLDLADRFGSRADDGTVHVPHELTQEELAQLVGASRETVNKSLAEFVSRGWIRLEGRGVHLLDVDRLRRRAR